MKNENLITRFKNTADNCHDQVCLRFRKNNEWNFLSWKDALAEVALLSEALKKIRVMSGDRVAILCRTRPEWILYDAAILSLGAITVPVYHNDLAEHILHILRDSQSKVVVVEDLTLLSKLLSIRHLAPQLEQIILLKGTVTNEGLRTHEEFRNLAKGTASDFDDRILGITQEQLASIVYTSGTSGMPKGVMLTHGNFLAELDALFKAHQLRKTDTALAFLPLAHILGRVLQWYQLTQGFECAYAEHIEKLEENILDIRPHVIACVPLFFEEIFRRILARVESESLLKKRIFNFAIKTGLTYSRYLQNKQQIPTTFKIKYAIASKLVLEKIHKRLGGRIRVLISGGAPLSPYICEFFHGTGLMILEGYGLTETTAAINVNTAQDYSFGTVGKPVLGVEEKIAKDGEILVRGPMVARGYWNEPIATAEVFDNDGWFHTGDIGEFDRQGFLKITDRKKDIIVTAGGKNIAPQNIENLLKTHPLISQVVVHGDKRKFLSALITLNQEELPKLAAALGILSRDPSAICNDPKTKKFIQKIVDKVNKKLANYETIKTFALLDKNLTIEGGELTPTLRVRRKVVNEKFRSLLDHLYEEPDTP